MARDDLPVLLQAALAHSQFEAIHPFGDGNGRTGRALIHTLLRRRGLTAGLIAPVSGVWVTDTSSYYEGLNAARGESEDGRNDWLSFFAASVEFAAAQAIVLVGEVSRLQARWRELLHTRSDASVLRLVELLPGHPVLSVAEVLGELSVSDVAALGALRTLTEHGILEVSTGRRNRVWFAPELLALLGEHDG
jgi:Fic family protein